MISFIILQTIYANKTLHPQHNVEQEFLKMQHIVANFVKIYFNWMGKVIV